MIRISFILLIISFPGLIFFSCSEKDNSQSLDSWIGKYKYSEEPIEAIAGHFMVMAWEFKIEKSAKNYLGTLEVNGQQTFIKLSANISGDSSGILAVYDKLIDGSSDLLKSGDTLFSFSKFKGKLHTTWYSLEPRLAESSPKECECFQRSK